LSESKLIEKDATTTTTTTTTATKTTTIILQRREEKKLPLSSRFFQDVRVNPKRRNLSQKE